MYNITSVVLKYIFIIIIYGFMLSIIRLIYLDIKGINRSKTKTNTYLRLINRKDDIPFKVYDSYPIKDNIYLGRGNENNIIIKDPFISKSHLHFSKKGRGYWVEDLSSANGTYLNDKKVEGKVQLKNKDMLRIGQLAFVFVDEE